MSWVNEVIKRARDHDAARPRSTQAAVGWSEVGGCRAAVGYRLDGAWATDDTDTWGAQRGTAIHEYLYGTDPHRARRPHRGQHRVPRHPWSRRPR